MILFQEALTLRREKISEVAKMKRVYVQAGEVEGTKDMKLIRKLILIMVRNKLQALGIHLNISTNKFLDT